VRALGLVLACAVAAGVSADPLAAASQTKGWVNYSVPLAGSEGPCCFENWQRGKPVRRACRLDRSQRDGMFGTLGGSGDRFDHRKLRPAGRPTLVMYLRFERGAVRELLAVGGDCPVEAGSHVVRTLEGVTPEASAALLLGLIEAPDEDLADEALHALVQHERVGTDALLTIVRDSRRPPSARRQALFWLGDSDDPRALAEIERILTR
jgi:hypothetical protein